MLVRATITLDEFIAARVRQLFGGNLSKGVNALLREHLSEKRERESMFGVFKGRVSVKDLRELKRVDLEDEKRDEALYS